MLTNKWSNVVINEILQMKLKKNMQMNHNGLGEDGAQWFDDCVVGGGAVNTDLQITTWTLSIQVKTHLVDLPVILEILVILVRDEYSLDSHTE